MITLSHMITEDLVSHLDVPLRVMCIDDNALLIDALERRLALEPGMNVVNRVENLADAVDCVVERAPSIVMLDIHLPDGHDALNILSGIVARAPASRVIIFTGHPTHELAVNALAAGAWGFVSKGIAVDRVIRAIRAVAIGEVVVENDEH